MNKSLLFATLICLIPTGCASQPPHDARGDVTPQAPVPDTAGRPDADTEFSLWPDPVIRTHVRLASLQHLIAQYERRHGTLPTTLHEVVPAGKGPVVLEHDAWGNVIRYTAASDDYILRSVGPDGLTETSDDIVARRGTELSVRGAPAHSRTETVIHSLRRLVLEYRRRTGALPDDLSSLPDAGLAPYLGTADEWGHPILYVRIGTRFTLTAPGPDGRAGTPDDLSVWGEAP